MFWSLTLLATLIALLAFRRNRTSRQRTESLDGLTSRGAPRWLGWTSVAILGVLVFGATFAVLDTSGPLWAQENTATAPSAEEDADAPKEGSSGDITDDTKDTPPVVTNTKGLRGESWFIALVTALIIIVPFVLGNLLAKYFRMPDYRAKFTVVLFCFLAGLGITVMGFPPKLGIDLKGGVNLVYEILGIVEDVDLAKESPVEGEDDTPREDIQRSGVDMGILTTALSKRIDPSQTREIVIREYGANQIEITIPDADENEVERIKRLIQRVGTLEFRILANNRDDRAIIAKADEDKTQTAKRVFDSKGKLLAWWVPVTKGQEDSFSGYGEIKVRNPPNDPTVTEILVINDEYDVSGEYLTRSEKSTQMGSYCVNFSFNTKGSVLFGYLTGDNIPDKVTGFSRKLGIILDESLYSAPKINEKISNRGVISGDFSEKEVEELVSVLNAGRLPARLTKDPISEMRTGPTLGEDLIRKGFWAISISMLLVLLFMLFYYRFAGIVACGALIMNLLMLMGIMIAIQAQFSLTGLAGLVLTVGMAVDANVLIFERIREELNRNATMRMAIRNGFSRATSAIVDANLTTLFTATILYWIGTDQVKGFAVILWLGVVLSMFTAIFCSRVVFDLAERQRWITALKMRQLIGVTKIDFLGKRHFAAICSAVVIAIGLIGVVDRGAGLLDIDFTGGVSIHAVFNTPQNIKDLRAKLSDLPDLSVSEVPIQGKKPNHRFRINTSTPQSKDGEKQIAGEEYLEQVKRVLEEKFRDQLRHYSLSVIPRTSESPSSDQATKPAVSQKPATPAVEVQGRNDLPPDTFFASADPNPMSFLLAQAEPAPEPEPPTEEPAPEPEPPTEEPAPEPEKTEPPTEEPTPEPEPPTEEPAPEPEKTDPPTEEPTPEPEPPTEEPAPEPEKTEPPTEEPAPEPEPPTEEPAPEPEPPTEEPAPEPEKTEPKNEEPAPEPEKTEPKNEEPAPEPEPPTEEPAPEPEKTEPPTEEPAPEPEKTEPKNEEPAPESIPEPITPTDIVNQVVTERELVFLSKMSEPAVRDMIREAADTPEWITQAVQFDIQNADPNYQPSTEKPYTNWIAQIYLPSEKADALLGLVKKNLESKPMFPSSATIGGKVASSTRTAAIVALIASLLVIVAYLWIRFQRVMYGLAAVVALVHDVLITLGMIALSAYVANFFGFLLIEEFKIGLPVLAAFLTIIGYSLNDTIVVFDRIREVKGKSVELSQEMINTSINQTLSRTLLTSLTTFLVVIILYFAGGEAIHTFAFALVVGVLVGTYSSIFVASPVLLWMSRSGSQSKQESKKKKSSEYPSRSL